jgi:hypothetical protein
MYSYKMELQNKDIHEMYDTTNTYTLIRHKERKRSKCSWQEMKKLQWMQLWILQILNYEMVIEEEHVTN